jgi:hypothetical protein
MSEPELDNLDFEEEDTLEYCFTDDEEADEDWEETTWEWDGDKWQKVA